MIYAHEMKIASENKVPPVVLIQHIVPVALEARNVAMAYAMHFGMNASFANQAKDVLSKYLKRFELDAEALPYGEGPIYIFRVQDRDRIQHEIEEMKKYHMNFFAARTEVSAKGRLLEYPACCICAFERDNTPSHHEATRIKGQLTSGGYVRKTDYGAEIKGAVMPAFFNDGFFPCSPECKSALETGNRIIFHIGDACDSQMLEAYETALLNNVLFAYLDLIHLQIPMEQKAYLLRKEQENERLFPVDQVRIV